MTDQAEESEVAIDDTVATASTRHATREPEAGGCPVGRDLGGCPVMHEDFSRMRAVG